MDFAEYQMLTESTAIYPEDEGIQYTTLGLVGESGEVAEKVKKWRREGDEAYLDDLEAELGDVLWYISQLCTELDISMADVAEGNIDKLLDRQERDVLTGEGDNR